MADYVTMSTCIVRTQTLVGHDSARRLYYNPIPPAINIQIDVSVSDIDCLIDPVMHAPTMTSLIGDGGAT